VTFFLQPASSGMTGPGRLIAEALRVGLMSVPGQQPVNGLATS